MFGFNNTSLGHLQITLIPKGRLIWRLRWPVLLEKVMEVLSCLHGASH